jgi:hypothetical protein
MLAKILINWKTIWQFLKMLKTYMYHVAQKFFSRVYTLPKLNTYTSIFTQNCTQMFVVALFILAKKYK